MFYQIGALSAFARSYGTVLQPVTPHGRLGNLVVTKVEYAEAVAEAVARFDPSLAVVTQAGALAESAARRGLPVGIMGLADRAYNDDGSLVSRSLPGSVITDPAEVVARTVRMVKEGVVRNVSGRDVQVECDTVLLHGDTHGSAELGRQIRSALLEAAIGLRPLAVCLGLKPIPDRTAGG